MALSCLLPTRVIARRVGKHHSAVLRWITKGAAVPTGGRLKLRATRTPGSWLVDPADLDSFLQELTARAVGHAETDHAPDTATEAALEAVGL